MKKIKKTASKPARPAYRTGRRRSGAKKGGEKKNKNKKDGEQACPPCLPDRQAKKRVQKGGRNKNQDKQSPQKRQGERFCHLRRDYQRISAHRRRCGAFGRYLRHF